MNSKRLCQQMDHEAAHELYQTLKAYDAGAKAKQVWHVAHASIRCKEDRKPAIHGRRYQWFTCRVLASAATQSNMQMVTQLDNAAMHQLCGASRHMHSQAAEVRVDITRERVMRAQLTDCQRAAGTGPESVIQTESIAAEGLPSDAGTLVSGGVATAG